MKLNITKGENGYIASWDKEGRERQTVFEYVDHEPDLKTEQRLFYFFLQLFDVDNSKHNKYRLTIDINEQH